MSELINDKQYWDLLIHLKQDIQQSRLRTHITVNQELICLYWRIGNEILKRKQDLGWGSKVVKQLAIDLKVTFPEMRGFSERNLVYMQTFASAYPDYEFTQAVPAQLPWYHNQTILDKIHNKETRLWYLKKTVEEGWSRNILLMHIQNESYKKIGNAQTNFNQVLSKPTSDLAQEIIKSEYNFEFLGLLESAHEKVIERSLISHIRNFLLELGTGFAFMGNQPKLIVGGEEFYPDLLFYHTKLRCYIVIELKTGKFTPSHLGQLEFYLTAINKDLKHQNDQPTIGLLLCQEANHVVVEYALSDKSQPLGVSKYSVITSSLPEGIKDALPTPQELQTYLEKMTNKG